MSEERREEIYQVLMNLLDEAESCRVAALRVAREISGRSVWKCEARPRIRRRIGDESVTPGDAKAQVDVGFMHQTGSGTSVNESEAVKWYEAAAAQGDTRALFNLGVMYYRGSGVAQDLRRALELFFGQRPEVNPRLQRWSRIFGHSWVRARTHAVIGSCGLVVNRD